MVAVAGALEWDDRVMFWVSMTRSILNDEASKLPLFLMPQTDAVR
jgi:hypothetical protein